MIWDPSEERGASSGSLPHDGLIGRIVKQLEQLFDTPQLLSDVQVEELSRAVEIYLSEHNSSLNSDDRCVVMLSSQALSSLGETAAARKMLVFGTGLIRPAVWEVSGESSMWVLDLRQMTVPSGSALEMVLFRSLSVILESIADVWDPSEGVGSLGLRHVCQTAAGLLNRGARTKEARDLADEIRERCDSLLADIASRRAWTATPQVLNLDM